MKSIDLMLRGSFCISITAMVILPAGDTSRAYWSRQRQIDELERDGDILRGRRQLDHELGRVRRGRGAGRCATAAAAAREREMPRDLLAVAASAARIRLIPRVARVDQLHDRLDAVRIALECLLVLVLAAIHDDLQGVLPVVVPRQRFERVLLPADRLARLGRLERVGDLPRLAAEL